MDRSTVQAGDTLGDFRLELLIGHGRNGRVFQARQLSLDRPVALKLFDDAPAADLQQLAALSHPHLVPIYAAGSQDGWVYLVLRRVVGPTFETLLQGGLSPVLGLRMLSQVAGALAAAHDRGLTHGNLHGGQILVADSMAQLTDIGLEQSGTVAGDVEALLELLERIGGGGQRLEQPGPTSAAQLHAQLEAQLACPELVDQARSLSLAIGSIDAPTLMLTRPAVRRPELLEQGQREFGKFQLLEVLGRGGMGVVYRALQTDLSRHVALKMLLDEGQPNAEATHRFLREARSAARLRHPHIVSVHEVGQVDGQHYFTMDLIEGGSLRERMEQGGLAIRDGLTLLAQVAHAVQHAHDQGVIHRDLKPGNIMVDEAGRALVTDFGLAKEVAGEVTELTRSGEVFGTPAYMPPEQAAGRIDQIGPHSDVYALGAVLYHLLTGRPPFSSDGGLQLLLMAVLMQEPIPPQTIEPRVHIDVQTICLKALEKQPARRYLSAVALAEDIERFLAGEPIEARPISRFARVLRRLSRRWLVVSSLSLALLMGLVALVGWRYQLSNRRREQLDRLRPQAFTQYQQGQFDRAGRLYREIMALDPGDAESQRQARDCARRLAGIRKLEGQLEGVTATRRSKIWGQVLQLNPHAARAWAERGWAKMNIPKHSVADALKDVERALLLRADQPTAHWAKANYYQDIRKDMGQAVYHYKEAARRASPDRRYRGLLEAARILTETRYFDRALKILDPLADEFPQRAQLPLLRAACLLAGGEHQQALAACRRALKIDPQSLRARLRISKILLRHGTRQAALAAARATCRSHPREAGPCLMLSSVLQRMGRFAAALSAIDRAIQLAPEDPVNRNERARFLLDRKQSDRARSDLDWVLRRHPQNAKALALSADLHFQQGRYSAAERDAHRALKYDTTSGVAGTVMARLYRRSGLLHNALNLHNKLRQLYPNRAGVLINRAGLLVELKQYAAAERDYKLAIGLDPSGLTFFALGYFHASRKQYAKAESELNRAIKLGYVRAYLTRGNMRSRLRRYREALADWDKTLELDRDPKRRELARANAAAVRQALKKKD